MTTSPTKDRSHESIINDTLARLLRERSGLSTAAETLHDGKRPDILVRLPEGPVILETEFEPAATVEADALSRLGMSIDGQRVQNVFAVTVPARLRSTNQRHLYQRLATATLVAGVADRRHLRPQAHRLRGRARQRRRPFNAAGRQPRRSGRCPRRRRQMGRLPTLFIPRHRRQGLQDLRRRARR